MILVRAAGAQKGSSVGGKEGEPSIARDNDGLSSSALNHIFAGGVWLPSNLYGITGDWIQRAHIRPL